MDPSLPWSDVDYWGPLLEPGLGAGHDGERLVAGPLPMGSGRAQPEEMTWDALPVGSPNPNHLQEGLTGSSAYSFGWQPKAGTLAARSQAAEASSRDV